MGVAANATPHKVYTLDFQKPVDNVEYNNDGYWTETYNPSRTRIEFGEDAIFRLSHCNTGFGGDDVGDGMSYWDGFTVSRNGDDNDYGTSSSSDGWVTHQWGCMAMGGIIFDAGGNVATEADGIPQVSPDAPYAVGYWSGSDSCNRIDIEADGEELFAAKNIYICIHPWTYYGIQYGDGFSRPFTEGDDFFSITIHGIDRNGNDNGKSVTHQFVSMEPSGEDGVYYPEMNIEWEKVDITSLGNIAGVSFTMDSSDRNPAFGINTAAYFCVGGMEVESLTVRDNSSVIGIENSQNEYSTLWFTIDGRQVSTPTLPGIYIRRSGNTTEKIKI